MQRGACALIALGFWSLSLPAFARAAEAQGMMTQPFTAAVQRTAAAVVDPSTLSHKLILGYQGWFACHGDAARQGWVHWLIGRAPTVDMLPDVTELSPEEKCKTDWIDPAGRPIYLYSAQNRATVDRHFAWMAEYGLDGVALQRFATHLRDPNLLAPLDRVLANVQAGAQAHGRVYFVMYDLSGMSGGDLDLVVKDWARLEREGISQGTAYLHHRGHPVLGLWGLGFAGRPISPDDGLKFLHALHAVSEAFGGISVVGGVPAYWRTGTRDASSEPGWQKVYRELQVISPWTVGRYADDAGADAYQQAVLTPDAAEAKRLGVDLMPVVFPGFSWKNLQIARNNEGNAIPNKIPRQCGRFYWRQVFDDVSGGATMLYNAMFDEVDEGTAMFKLVPDSKDSPRDPSFLTLDADGCHLPSDWYLRLAAAATKSFAGTDHISSDIPLQIP